MNRMPRHSPTGDGGLPSRLARAGFFVPQVRPANSRGMCQAVSNGDMRSGEFASILVRAQLSTAFPVTSPTTAAAKRELDPLFAKLQGRVAGLIANARCAHPLGVTAYTPAAFGAEYPAL